MHQKTTKGIPNSERQTTLTTVPTGDLFPVRNLRKATHAVFSVFEVFRAVFIFEETRASNYYPTIDWLTIRGWVWELTVQLLIAPNALSLQRSDISYHRCPILQSKMMRNFLLSFAKKYNGLLVRLTSLWQTKIVVYHCTHLIQ